MILEPSHSILCLFLKGKRVVKLVTTFERVELYEHASTLFLSSLLGWMAINTLEQVCFRIQISKVFPKTALVVRCYKLVVSFLFSFNDQTHWIAFWKTKFKRNWKRNKLRQCEIDRFFERKTARNFSVNMVSRFL